MASQKNAELWEDTNWKIRKFSLLNTKEHLHSCYIYLSGFFWFVCFFPQVFSRIVFILLPALPFSLLFSWHNFQMDTLEYNRVAFTYYLSIPVTTENVGHESSKFSTIIQSEFLFHVADFAASPSFLQKRHDLSAFTNCTNHRTPGSIADWIKSWRCKYLLMIFRKLLSWNLHFIHSHNISIKKFSHSWSSVLCFVAKCVLFFFLLLFFLIYILFPFTCSFVPPQLAVVFLSFLAKTFLCRFLISLFLSYLVF